MRRWKLHLIFVAAAMIANSSLLAQLPRGRAPRKPPDGAALVISEKRDRQNGDTYTIAQLNGVAICIYVPNAEGAQIDPEVTDEEGATERAAIGRTPTIEFLNGTMEEFAFGEGTKPQAIDSAADTLTNQLHHEIERVHKACQLTDGQRKKLELAGRIDIIRFVNRVTRLKGGFMQTEQILTASQFCDWITPLSREAQLLDGMLKEGLFDDDSFYEKTSRAILSRDQLADRADSGPLGGQVPDIPSEGWINGTAPDYKGKPYLIHYWATSVPGSRQDLPILKQLADEGACILGIHPLSSPSTTIASVSRKEGLSYPTLAPTHATLPAYRNIDGCHVKSVPYCIVVDRRGFVAAHGQLGPKLLKTFQELQEAAARRASQNLRTVP